MAKFTELPGKVQLAVVIGLLVVITGALYWFVYQDMDKHNRETRATLKAKEEENAALRPYADKKADMERSIGKAGSVPVAAPSRPGINNCRMVTETSGLLPPTLRL